MDSMAIDLSIARHHHRSGELDQAARLYEAALSENPHRDDALHLLGMIALKKGDLARAMTLVERAVALRPDVADYRTALAEVYRILGLPDRAVQSHLEAHRLAPQSPEILCNLGALLIDLGQIDAAIGWLREAVRLNPNFAGGHNNLANALRLQGNSAAALEHFRASVRLNPGSARSQSNLGQHLLDRGEPTEALTHCQEAVRLQPSLVEARVNLGNVLHILGRLEEAEACLREAIRLRPGSAAAHAGLGGVLEQLDDLEQSLTIYREALRLDPRHTGVLARLATRLRGKLPEAEQAAIEGLLAQQALPSDRRVPLLYGLAHVLDARGEFDRAAALTTEANARQREEFERRGLGYDPAKHAAFVDSLIESFPSTFFERVRGWGLTSERPVLIFGLPRSGTSLVEQILASHPRVFGAGELRLAGETFNAIPEEAGRAATLTECLQRLDRSGLQRLANYYLDGLAAINSIADRVVDKMPENTLYLGLLAAMFPSSKLIYCRRDLRDVALSCWMTNFGLVRWACDPDHIASRMAQAARLMDHWQSVLPVPMLEIQYEDVVNNQEAKSRELIDWCGLEWDPNCLEFHKTRRPVRTASVAQVRQPIYPGSIGRWKNYEKSLARLFETLVSIRESDKTGPTNPEAIPPSPPTV
jgi:tetratricopeptide (TPR) repeat protein